MIESETIAVKIGYQGVPGAYSEEALSSFLPEAQAVSYRTLPDLFAALEEGEIGQAFVPVENSHTGSVAEAYDLMLDQAVTVIAEWMHSVNHGLLGMRNAEPAEIERGFSHPQVPADSATRFFLLEHGNWTPDRTVVDEGMGKTSLVFAVEHRPGALVRALSCFSRQQVNLTRLESRPSRQRPWEYLFFIDVEGYTHEPRIRAALRELTRLIPFVRILGSYPAASDPLRGSSAESAGRTAAGRGQEGNR